MRSRTVLWLAGSAILAAAISFGVLSSSAGRGAARAGIDQRAGESPSARAREPGSAPATVAGDSDAGRRALEVERTELVVPVEEPIPAGCGAFAGRVICDAGLPAEHIVVSAGSPDRWRTRHLDPDGSFRFADLLPGQSMCSVRADTLVVLFEEDLVIVAGETARHSRLDPLDLRGRYRILRLRVLRPDGEPLAGEHVALQESGGLQRSTELDAQGRLELSVYAKVERFLLDLPYFRSTWVTWSAAEQDVRLRPPLQLWLDLDSSCADMYESLAVAVVPSPALGRATSAIEHRIAPDGSAEFVLELTGSYRLEWRVLGVIPPVPLEGQPREIDVVDSEGPQRIPCSFDAATLASIRAELAR